MAPLSHQRVPSSRTLPRASLIVMLRQICFQMPWLQLFSLCKCWRQRVLRFAIPIDIGPRVRETGGGTRGVVVWWNGGLEVDLSRSSPGSWAGGFDCGVVCSWLGMELRCLTKRLPVQGGTVGRLGRACYAPKKVEFVEQLLLCYNRRRSSALCSSSAAVRRLVASEYNCDNPLTR